MADPNRRCERPPDRLPDDIDAAVRKNGLETDGFIRVVESDMDFDGCYLTAWTALDDKGIYFILGDEKLTKKRGNKKIKSEYELRESTLLSASRILILSNASSMFQQAAL